MTSDPPAVSKFSVWRRVLACVVSHHRVGGCVGWFTDIPCVHGDLLHVLGRVITMVIFLNSMPIAPLYMYMKVCPYCNQAANDSLNGYSFNPADKQQSVDEHWQEYPSDIYLLSQYISK